MIHDLMSNLLDWIESLGYFGILIGLMVEVIPSEIVLGYAGYRRTIASGLDACCWAAGN